MNKKIRLFEQFIAMVSLLTAKNPEWPLASIYITAAGKTMPTIDFEDFCSASCVIGPDSSIKSIFDSFWDVYLNSLTEGQYV
ncbi:hypothetical protein KNT81_gp004 [Proteus phage phiP4-3]|uniref:Uncharacterized protein n=1 Tax=Proteus phage phiP4-3 TaxID=2065203 RepID=A0A2I6PF66_9CAUD|nr:hypothetical protein KNT81_gp004 [Proteus phage phiP4-3]AUM58364.1 hypothetical protein phiP43_004 [Proteus phage phiP4-3]AZV01385.1 hypothetical protein vBSdyM006_248 [Shigella phage vB_SdyM_006]